MANTIGAKGSAFDLDDANVNSCSNFVNQLIAKSAIKLTADLNDNQTITVISTVSVV